MKFFIVNGAPQSWLYLIEIFEDKWLIFGASIDRAISHSEAKHKKLTRAALQNHKEPLNNNYMSGDDKAL